MTGNSQTADPTAANSLGGGIVNILGTAILNHSQVTGNTAAHGGGILTTAER